MNTETMVVVFTWMQPESGVGVEHWRLTLNEWQDVGKVIDWVFEQKDEEVGDTIPRATILASGGVSTKQSKIKAVMETLATNARYSTGEELYEENCPIFTKYNIKRS